MTNRPLPPEIYRRRRIAALVLAIALILVIVGIVRWAAGGTDAGTDQAAEVSESVTVTRDDGVENTSAPDGPSSEPYTTNPASETPATVDKDTCELGDLILTVTADAPNYADDNPRFALTMANPTNADCDINLDEDTLRFEVYDMLTYSASG